MSRIGPSWVLSQGWGEWNLVCLQPRSASVEEKTCLKKFTQFPNCRLHKLCLLELSLNLVWEFKETGWSRISIGKGNLLFVKCNKALINPFPCLSIPPENRIYRKGPVIWNELDAWKKFCLVLLGFEFV